MPYATAIVARFDHVPLRLACVNAGHPSGHLLRDGGASTLESGGPPLGLLPEAKYVASTVELQPGDIGVLDRANTTLRATGKWKLNLTAEALRKAAQPTMSPRTGGVPPDS